MYERICVRMYVRMNACMCACVYVWTQHLLFAASSRLSFLAPRFTYPLHIALSHNDRFQQTQLLQTQLDDLEAYTNSNERSRIHSATVESAERDHVGYMEGISEARGQKGKTGRGSE